MSSHVRQQPNTITNLRIHEHSISIFHSKNETQCRILFLSLSSEMQFLVKDEKNIMRFACYSYCCCCWCCWLKILCNRSQFILMYAIVWWYITLHTFTDNALWQAAQTHSYYIHSHAERERDTQRDTCRQCQLLMRTFHQKLCIFVGIQTIVVTLYIHSQIIHDNAYFM